MAVLGAVVGLHRLQARRQCRVHLRFPAGRLRRHLRDKVVEDRAVLQQELAPEARRPWTSQAIGYHW